MSETTGQGWDGLLFSVNVRRIHLENWTEVKLQQLQTGGHTKEAMEMCFFFTLKHINYVL